MRKLPFDIVKDKSTKDVYQERLLKVVSQSGTRYYEVSEPKEQKPKAKVAFGRCPNATKGY